MDFFNGWLQGIIVAVIITVVIEMILPNGNSKKYIKIVLGMYVVFSIISPVIGKVTGNEFEVSSIINMDIYAKELGTYEETVKNRNLEYSTNENIKQIYITKLKEDIIAKLKSKGYTVKKIELNIENDESYSIKDVTIYIDSKKQEENAQEEKNSIINEIEIINITIGNINEKEKQTELEKEEKNVTHLEKTEIIRYVSETYGIDEKKITIY